MAVILTYKRFKEMVPASTAHFVEQVLPYLKYYIGRDIMVQYKNDSSAHRNYSKALVLMLEKYHDVNEVAASGLSAHGYNKNRAKIIKNIHDKVGSIDSDAVFNEFSNYFCVADELKHYQILTPAEIVSYVKRQYSNSGHYENVSYLFDGSSNNLDNYFNFLNKKITQERDSHTAVIRKELFGNLRIETINYLEAVSQVHKVLAKQKGKSLLVDDEDIEAVSRMLGLYYYNAIEAEGRITEKEAIIEIFANKGISLEQIYKCLGFSYSRSTIESEKEDVLVLAKRYRKYIREGSNSGKKDEDIVVRDMVKGLFDREFNGSLAIEKLLASANSYTGMFDNLDEQIDRMVEEQAKVRALKSINDFYAELPKETRDFMEFTAKAYMLIINKMQEKTHNAELLTVEGDADTLALFISAHYFSNDIKYFFEDHGVNLDKTMELLKMSITGEEIEAIKLDEQVLVKEYKHFVYDGVNRQKKPAMITINDVVRNLCSRTFNQSMIIENIYAELSTNHALGSDFLEHLETDIAHKENNRKRELTQKLFKDMPASSMEYLENISRIHQFLLNNKANLSKKDIQIVSMILGIEFTTDDIVNGLFKELDLNINKVLNHLNVSCRRSADLIQAPVDIDLIYSEYGELIFGGANKDRERKELTIKNLSFNIFNRDLNNSVMISRLLATANLDYDYFNNLEGHYSDYVEKTRKQAIEKEKNNLLYGYSNNAESYMNDVSIIHNRIAEVLKQGTCNLDIIRNDDDIEEIAMLLALYLKTNNIVNFIKRNKLELAEVLEYLGLDMNILQNLQTSEIDNELIVNNYKKYLVYKTYGHNSDIDDIARKMFDTSINKSLAIEQLTSHFGSVYDILKEEVETGQEYIAVLSNEERLQLIVDEPVPELDLSSMKAILNFGNTLSLHSQYIHNELPKLEMSDTHSKSVSSINEIIGRMYNKDLEQPKRRLFGFKKQEEQPARLILNSGAVAELRDAIDSNINNLSTELLGYDYIRQYVEIYRRKNRLHFLKSEEACGDLTKRLEQLDPNDDEQMYEFLTVSSNIRILNDKINRFSTSNYLMKQELAKINQAIVNHFITINALEMARDDLIPLIGSELAILKGRDTGNAALDLSGNVVGLFKAILNRNVESTVENLEKLKKATIDQSVLELSIKSYFESLGGLTSINSRVENFEIDTQPKLILAKEPAIDTEYTDIEVPKVKQKEKSV